MAYQAKLEEQSRQSQQELAIVNQQMDELFRQCDAVFAGLRIGMRERDIQNQQPTAGALRFTPFKRRAALGMSGFGAIAAAGTSTSIMGS
jgi:hypothetical protein